MRSTGEISWRRLQREHGEAGRYPLREIARLLGPKDATELTDAEILTIADRVAHRLVYTIHTPVKAGHDRFDRTLYAQIARKSSRRILNQLAWDDESPSQYNFTSFAMRVNRAVNSVSRLHRDVTRRQFPDVADMISAITNGVHLPTWASANRTVLFDSCASLNGWRNDPGCSPAPTCPETAISAASSRRPGTATTRPSSITSMPMGQYGPVWEGVASQDGVEGEGGTERPPHIESLSRKNFRGIVMEDYLRYLLHTKEDVREMLETIGIKNVEDLFEAIPKKSRLSEPLNLLRPLSEADLIRHLEGVQSQTYASFLGGGAYHHFIPAVVSHLTSRSEFYTAYTPYQPEISQGTLQAIFEYQTLMCQLTGMEISNASMYDGASSVAEAVMMAYRITGRKKVLLSQAIHPEYQEVLKTLYRPR